MKMVWGVNEESPCHVSLLFPAPYEAVAGERFVEYQSELPANLENGAAAVGGEEDDVISTMSMRSTTTPRGGNKANSRKSFRSTRGGPGGGGAMESIISGAMRGWRKMGNSRTGTCMKLESDRMPGGNNQSNNNSMYDNHNYNNSSSNSNNSIAPNTIPPLILTWRGDEPLDRLHVVLKASMVSRSIQAPTSMSSSMKARSMSRGTSLGGSSLLLSDGGMGGGGGGGGGDDNNDEEKMVGHCSIALEQLCKVALVGAATSHGGITTSVARILVSRGRPMYNIDLKTMQREMVTFCCRLELLQT